MPISETEAMQAERAGQKQQEQLRETKESKKECKQVRYAVVGLGYIAQAAVLPAFAHAKKNSQLAALVSGDAKKLKTLGRKYTIDALYSYDQYDDLLHSGEINAVYIALPNHMHAEYT